MKACFAVRPVFLPGRCGDEPVMTQNVRFRWFPGLALAQQRLSIEALHEQALSQHPELGAVLEVSTRSDQPAGRALSAFNLSLKLPRIGLVALESAYQCAKVHADGGPWPELIGQDPMTVRRRLATYRDSPLLGFRLFDQSWPLVPCSLFYDWIYAHALCSHPDLLEQARAFSAFTDIAFNPKRSLACQAGALARVIFLLERDLLDQALASPENFRLLAFRAPAENKQGELAF